MKKIMCRYSNIQKGLIHCESDNPEDVIKAITTEKFIGKFNKDEYKYVDETQIKNDDNLYITFDGELYNVWQYRGKETSIINEVIPHVHKVRRIGLIVTVGGGKLVHE